MPTAPSSQDENVSVPSWLQSGSGSPGRSGMQNPEQRIYIDPLAAGFSVPPSASPSADRYAPTIRKPITDRSEFELFAEDAAGRPLPVYGRQLFDQVPSTFAPMDRVPVPANYVIGAGDELLVRVWGKIEFQARVMVDRNGQIFVPRVGALIVAGIRYDQLESYIHSAIANLYKDFELNVTMGQLRSIQIFVLGNARQPGVYTVSSLSTLVTALFASGGPSASGSMRQIELRRGSKVVTQFDIYEMLRKGDKSCDAQLLPGDVIYIPPVGPQAAVLGSITEPGIYELKGEPTIASILKDAAGLTNLASVDRALLERVESHRRRQVDEFSLDGAGLERELKDGDILRIFPISPRFENAITLRGNVAQPGRYLWHEGMRISDLIPTRNVLLTRAYWNQQNFLASTLPPELPPESSTTQEIASAGAWSQSGFPDRSDPSNGFSRQFVPNLPSGQAGMPQRNGVQNNPVAREHWDRPQPVVDTPNHDVMTDVVQAGTEINWEYAAIERRDDNDLTTRVIAFNLGKAIDTISSPDNQPLKPGDVVTIFSRKDIPLPQDKHAAFVRIGGEVLAPGVYRVEPGETLRQVVERAGGLTPHSYLYASQLARESTRKAQEEELRLSTAQMQRDLSSRYATANSLAPTNTAEQQAQYNAQQALINQLSALHPTGRIVLDMKPDAASTKDIPEFPLEDGDSYYVPAKLGTVQVSGAVYNENAFRYQEDKRVSTYLEAAGGPTRQADVKRIFLIRADGMVVSKQHQSGPWRSSFAGMQILPGDSIVVPTKMKSPTSFMQQLPFIAQILSQTAMTGAVIGTR
jgi:protein involved in polysaccharide export with SLBB domain